MSTPEARARVEIDRLLTEAGWHVCDLKEANIHGARGVAVREFPLEADHGDADYPSNQVDKTARVCICTIQRMCAMLKGEELPDEDEEPAARVESQLWYPLIRRQRRIFMPG